MEVMYIEEPDGSTSVVPVKDMERYNTIKLNKLELEVLALKRKLDSIINETVNIDKTKI